MHFVWSYHVAEIAGLLQLLFLVGHSLIVHLYYDKSHSFIFLSLLFAGSVYGVLLEFLSMYLLKGYVYGSQFLVMVGGVPIIIGICWSLIIYTSIETTDSIFKFHTSPLKRTRVGMGEEINGDQKPASTFKDWFIWIWFEVIVKSTFDGLLALNLDFSLDAVAIRDGMWLWEKWNVDLGQMFGVPLTNYYAWLVVVVFYSVCFRLSRFICRECKFAYVFTTIDNSQMVEETSELLQESTSSSPMQIRTNLKYLNERQRRNFITISLFEIILPFLSIPVSLVLLFGSLVVYGLILMVAIELTNMPLASWFLFSICVAASIVIVLLSYSIDYIIAFKRRKARDIVKLKNTSLTTRFLLKTMLHIGGISIPIQIHGWFLIILLAKGMYKENVWILIVSLLMSVLGGMIHVFALVRNCGLWLLQRYNQNPTVATVAENTLVDK